MAIRTLGTAQVDCGAWASIRDFLDPRILNSQYLADAYQCAQYGSKNGWGSTSIPSPGTPSPSAPQTYTQMTAPSAWTPAQSYNTAADWAAATTVAKIKAAEADGYNPSGNLPVTATDLDAIVKQLDAYKWPLILGGSAVLLFVLWKVK